MIKNLKKLRNEYRVSQQKLAEQIMVSQQSINKYENHSVEPDIGTLIKIADYFNVTVDYLIGRTDDASDRGQEAMDLNAAAGRWYSSSEEALMFYRLVTDRRFAEAVRKVVKAKKLASSGETEEFSDPTLIKAAEVFLTISREAIK